METPQDGMRFYTKNKKCFDQNLYSERRFEEIFTHGEVLKRHDNRTVNKLDAYGRLLHHMISNIIIPNVGHKSSITNMHSFVMLALHEHRRMNFVFMAIEHMVATQSSSTKCLPYGCFITKIFQHFVTNLVGVGDHIGPATETKYIATIEAIKKVIWLQGLLNELHVLHSKAIIYIDSMRLFENLSYNSQQQATSSPLNVLPTNSPNVQDIYAICSSPSHVIYDCPSASLFPEFVHEQVNATQGFHRQNDPYSNIYNPGWRNHPNFSWRQQGGEDQLGWQQYQQNKQFGTTALPGFQSHTSSSLSKWKLYF
ncbi:hypothetical protein M9H77_36504 [Catharanthus roseus]|uniref:Uncharacterized protein n=1 Tax=Catharanthus roseus TaxID=4058 RepID=A0ACB9ZT13_CATRO|nr:hypothetical protein M9H77_36504 [Catharanthus roseus]